jgi:myosin-1
MKYVCIIYKFCFILTKVYLAQWSLQPPENFRYLNQSKCYTIPEEDKIMKYYELKEALNSSNFTPEEQSDIFGLVSSILLLGNLKFIPLDNDTTKVDDQKGI